MTAVADEQVARTRSRVAPRSSVPSLRHEARIDVAELRTDDGRAAAVLGQARGDQPDDARRGHGPWTTVAGDRTVSALDPPRVPRRPRSS